MSSVVDLGMGWAELRDRAVARTLQAVAEAPVRSGHYVTDGHWQQVPIAERSSWNGPDYDHGNWTTGFWVGVLDLLDEPADPRHRELITALAGATAVRAIDATTHDLGFMFWPSACALADRARSAGEEPAAERWARVALTAAEQLAARFRPEAGYLQAFGALDDDRGRGTTTIDTMMNLPLLWWAADRFDRPDLRDKAISHAHATGRDLVRPDGGTYHLGRHAAGGGMASLGTFQGAGDESCWTRGQAWAVHGYVNAYLATGDPAFAELAERCLSYWLDRAPLTRLPPYDLLAETGLADASAGAILASGLAEACADAALAGRLDARERLATVLSCLARDALFAGPVGIVWHSTYSKPHGWGVDGALPYGDYFFVRALVRARGLGLLALPQDAGHDR